MNDKDDADLDRSGPSQEAEQCLRDSDAPPSESMAEVDARAPVHELQVHQIELEMQNEELLRSQAAVEDASGKCHDLDVEHKRAKSEREIAIELLA